MADVVPDQPDLDQGQPLAQGRLSTSSSRTTPRATAASARGRGPGSSPSTPTPTTRSTPTTATRTRSRVASSDYTEIDAFSEVQRQALHLGVLRAGHVEGQPAADASTTACASSGTRRGTRAQPAAVFVPERYDPAKAPRLYQPARVNNVERRARSGHRRRRCPTSSSARSCRALATATTAWSPTAIPTTRRASATARASSPSRGSGLAWDLTGDGKTGAARERRALPQPPRQRERPGCDGAKPTGAEHARASSTGRWTRCWRPARRARSRIARATSSASSATRKTPKSYNYSVGIQREIGWGTVLDVTYAGFQMRNGEMAYEHQHRAGRRALRRRQPAERQPAEPDARPSRTSSCGRISGTRTSRSASTSATRDLQLHAGAAQPPLHQRPAVRGRLHARRRRGRRHGGDHQPQHRSARRRMERGPGALDAAARTISSSTTPGTCRTAALVEQLAHARLARRLAALRATRPSSAATGPAPTSPRPTTSTSRRRRRRSRPDMTGEHDRCSGEQLRSDSGRHGQLLERRRRSPARPAAAISAMRRCTFFRLPGSCCRTCRSSRTSSSAAEADPVPLGGLQRVQPGNWSAINTTAQFNPAGEQVNASFGKALRRRATRASCRGRFGSRSEPQNRIIRQHSQTAADNTDKCE